MRVEEALLARLHEVVDQWCKQLSVGNARSSSPSDPATEVSSFQVHDMHT